MTHLTVPLENGKILNMPRELGVLAPPVLDTEKKKESRAEETGQVNG